MEEIFAGTIFVTLWPILESVSSGKLNQEHYQKKVK